MQATGPRNGAPSTEPRAFAHAAALVLLLIAASLAVRILSPSDILTNDQSRTVSYTIDMVRNGHWILAADADGLPATKPPLVNYLSAPFVALFGPSEWTFFLPSLVCYVGTLWVVYGAARRAFGRLASQGSLAGIDGRDWGPLLAVAFLGISYMMLRQAFIARPDMLLVFLMTLTWFAAEAALQAEPPAARGWAALFWTAAALAAVAKGPLAALPVIHGFLSARLIHGDWRRARRLHPAIGLPAALAAALAWYAAAYLANPEHVLQILFRQELLDRFGAAWSDPILNVWHLPFYFVTRFLPWSVLVLVAAFHFPWRGWARHPLAPTILYLAILAATFALVADQRGDRFAPFYPPAALVAAWAALHARPGVHWRRAWVVAIPVAAILIGANFLWFERPGDPRGDSFLDFAAKARAIVGEDPVVFCQFGNRGIPAQAFLGVNQRGVYPSQAPAGGSWVVTPDAVPAPAEAVLVSEPLRPLNDRRFSLYLAPAGSRICS